MPAAAHTPRRRRTDTRNATAAEGPRRDGAGGWSVASARTAALAFGSVLSNARGVCPKSGLKFLRQIESRYLFLFHNAPYTSSTTPKDTPTAEVVLYATEIHRGKNPPKRSPPPPPEQQAGPRTRTTARHRHACRHVTETEPISTRAAHPARNRPETAPDERGTSGSLKALINAVAEIPAVSSL